MKLHLSSTPFALILATSLVCGSALAGSLPLVDVKLDEETSGAPPSVKTSVDGQPLDGPTLIKTTGESSILVEVNDVGGTGSVSKMLVFNKRPDSYCFAGFAIPEDLSEKGKSLSIKTTLLLSKGQAKGNCYFSLAGAQSRTGYVQIGADGNVSVTESGARSGNTRFGNLPLGEPVEIELQLDFAKGEMSMMANGEQIFSNMAFDAGSLVQSLEIGSTAKDAIREFSIIKLLVTD